MHPLDLHALFSRGLASGSTRGLRLPTSPAATKKSVSIGMILVAHQLRYGLFTLARESSGHSRGSKERGDE